MSNQKDFSAEEWSNRVNLAACYHLADHFQMSDIIWNHITVRTSSEKNTFLINKFGLRFEKLFIFNSINPDKLINIPTIDNLDTSSFISEIPKMGVNKFPNPLDKG